MRRLLVTLFAIAAVGGGAVVAFADSTPVGPLPPGPAAAIDVQHGELVALALPQRGAASPKALESRRFVVRVH